MLQGWHSGNNPNVFKGLEENKLLLSQLDESQFCCTPSSSVCPLTSSLHWGWSLHRDKQDFRADQLLKRNSFVCYWRPSDHYISTTIDLCSEVNAHVIHLFFSWGWWGSTGYCAVKFKQARRNRQYTLQGAVDTTCQQGVLLYQQPFVYTLTWGHSCFALWI